jgi:hypothetical protein
VQDSRRYARHRPPAMGQAPEPAWTTLRRARPQELT